MIKKISLLFIGFFITLSLFSQPENAPLGKTKTEVMTIFIMDYKCKLLQEDLDSYMYLDPRTNFAHVCFFNKAGRVDKYYIFLPPDISLVQKIIKSLDGKYYRIDNDILVWLDYPNNQKAKYLMSLSINLSSDVFVLMITYNK